MIRLLLLITSFFFLSDLTHAQWVTYRSDNTVGLSSDLVSSIHEGIDGFLWFGTDNGVVKFDRNNNTWNRYTTANGLNNDFIYDVESFNSNTIWVATNGGGVSKYYGGLWTSYDTDNGLASNIVRAITKDNSGNIWFATYGGGLSKFYNNQWTTYDNTNGMPTNNFYSAFTDADGNLWFGTSNKGVMRFDNTWTNFTETDGLAGNTVLSISQTADGRMLFAGTNGVSIFDGSNWQTITTADGLPANLAYSVMEDAEGKIRIGTDSGMSIYDGTTLTTLTTANGLSSDKVYCIMQDSQDDIWLGHIEGGTSYYNGTQWLNYHNSIGLPSNWVNDVCEDLNGNMWFISEGGITKYDGLNWETYQLSGTNIVVDSSNTIWVSAYSAGLRKYNGVNWTTITTNEGLPVSNNVAYVFVDSRNNLWVSHGYYGGISKFDGNTWVTYDNSDGVTINYVDRIFEDSNGNIWLIYSWDSYINTGMITKFDGINWTNYMDTEYINPGVQESFNSGIAEDEYGNIWFTFREYYPSPFWMWKGGLLKFDGNNFSRIVGSPLHSNQPMEVFFDSFNRLWAGGQPHIYNNDTVISIMEGNVWSYIGMSDGIAGINITKFYEDSYQNIWVCTNNGVSKGNLLTVGIPYAEAENFQPLQNYPNPFNEQTTIDYTLEKETAVQLTVFDVSGKQITQVNYGRQMAGQQKIIFDGSLLIEGIYFYHLLFGNQIATGKMSIMN